MNELEIRDKGSWFVHSIMALITGLIILRGLYSIFQALLIELTQTSNG